MQSDFLYRVNVLSIWFEITMSKTLYSSMKFLSIINKAVLSQFYSEIKMCEDLVDLIICSREANRFHLNIERNHKIVEQRFLTIFHILAFLS